MRIEQMEAREPYEHTLLRTLTMGWGEQYNYPLRVMAWDRSPRGQKWRLSPVLSAYVCPPTSRETRRFLASTFRFTPHRKRAVPQFFAAGLLTTSPALMLATKKGFRVDPGIPDAGTKIVQPGNQRVRVFDFQTATTRVFVKWGFSAETMAREIAVRSQSGPFLPILAKGADASWLEEPLVDAWALPRCPPWIDRRDAEHAALAKLDAWLSQTRRSRDAKTVAAERLQAVRHLAGLVNARFHGTATVTLLDACNRLADVVAGMGQVELAQSHGDLQPGNILVSRHLSWGERAVWLIDWEHSRPRSIDYDRFTLGLGTRNQDDLGALWRGYLDGSVRPELLAHLRTPAERRAALSLYVLEDIAFYLSESLTGPYVRPSGGVGRHVRALSALS